MSMLSAQCDELRSMAESVGLAMPQAATLMMDAADTIWELRNKLAGMVDMRERARLAEIENAKLRELVAELYQCSRQYGCDRCGYKDGCAMFDRMAQLGVEVEHE